MAEATGLFLADFEENNTSEFDSITQEGSNTFSASTSAALHGTYGARATFDGTNNDAYGTKALTARTELWARAYFRFNADFSGNTGYLFPLVIKSGSSNRIYPRMLMSGSDVVITRFYYQSDAGAGYVTVDSVVVSKNVTHYIEIYHKSASTAGANDGIARLYLDGSLVSEVTSIDSDTVTVDGIYAGQRGTIVPTLGSYIDIDDVKMDSAYIGPYFSGIEGAGNIASAESFGLLVIGSTSGISGAGGITSSEAFGVQSLSAVIASTGIASALTFGTPRVGATIPIIIDHTSVANYANIPQTYIDAVKQMWFDLPGESHSMGYRIGLALLEAADSKFQVNVTESGTPEGPTSSYLRASRATWGDYDDATGWIYSYGEEDWYTSDSSRIATKRHIQYCYDNTFGLSALGFGWCWDETWHNGVTATKDPVYKCGWAGSSVGGPEGDLPWGLDAEDTAITGNSVNLDTYLSATQEYIDYCDANGIPTKVFFTTGPVDGYSGESGYQRHLKHERIRNYVDTYGGLFFDYADILAWDNAGTENLQTWTDGDGGTHQYQMIAADNMLDLDGTYVEDGDHIGQRGALRLAKAVWVMLAITAGWDGNLVGIEGAGNVASSESVGSASISASVTTTAIASSELFGLPTISAEFSISGAGNIASSESVGSVSLSASITTTSIASSESFGSPTVGGIHDVGNIDSAESFGSALLSASITATAMSSSEAFGMPSVGSVVTTKTAAISILARKESITFLARKPEITMVVI